MVSLRNSFFDRTDSEVGSSSPLLCGGRTEGAANASYHIGRGTFDSTIFIFHAPIQARILFETFFGVEGVESSPRLCDTEFRYLGWAPLFCHNPVSQVVRYLRQECGAASSVRAGIPHPFKCAAAAVQTLSHPLLLPPHTYPVERTNRYQKHPHRCLEARRDTLISYPRVQNKYYRHKTEV